MKSIFLENLHHAYAQTDGTYKFPNSRDGDMLRQAMREIEEMQNRKSEVRKAFICKHCDGVYADEPVTQCDCLVGLEGQEFIEGIIEYKK